MGRNMSLKRKAARKGCTSWPSSGQGGGKGTFKGAYIGGRKGDKEQIKEARRGGAVLQEVHSYYLSVKRERNSRGARNRRRAFSWEKR